MKKLVLVLSIVFVTMSSFTFESANCHDYAQAAVAQESAAYGVVYGPSQYANAYTFYHNSCVSVGGNIGAPVNL